jgi:DNA-binding NtrC family response regulator
MSHHQRKHSAQTDTADRLASLLDRSGASAESISKLRRLISELMNEVESLDEKSLNLSAADTSETIDFYEEIKRFEIALIKRALRQTNGHQLLAARLLNLNPTTLNAKIKQYRLGSKVSE